MPKATDVSESSALKKWKKLLKEYSSLLLWALGSTAVPICSYFLSISPPEPRGIIAFTAIVEVMAVILAYLFLSRISLKKMRIIMAFCFISFIALTMYYTTSFSRLTYTTEVNERDIIVEHYMRGLTCLENIETQYPGACPRLTREIIADRGNENEKLWTEESIEQATNILLTAWFALFAVISFSLAGFLTFLIHRR